MISIILLSSYFQILKTKIKVSIFNFAKKFYEKRNRKISDEFKKELNKYGLRDDEKREEGKFIKEVKCSDQIWCSIISKAGCCSGFTLHKAYASMSCLSSC